VPQCSRCSTTSKQILSILSHSWFPPLHSLPPSPFFQPMISVLKHLLHNPSRVRGVFFYWATPYKQCFEWFSSILKIVYDHQCDARTCENTSKDSSSSPALVLEVRNFLTSAKRDDRDLGAVLLYHAANTVHANTKVDILLGQHSHEPVQVGRPNWEKELGRVAKRCQEWSERRCGVFLCGPQGMADEVRGACTKITTKSRGDTKNQQPVHLYFSKETF
jgi:hypothetical protein